MSARLNFNATEPKGFIFDFDGTLADSMGVWKYIDDEFMRRHNIEAVDEYKKLIVALGFEAGSKWVAKYFDLGICAEEIQQEWIDLAKASYEKYVVLNPGAIDYVKAVRAAGLPTSIATSLNIDLLKSALRANNAIDLFDGLVSCDECSSEGKLEPTVYLEAAKKMSALTNTEITLNDCVVFEDISLAASTAKKAGATVVGKLNKIVEDVEGFSDNNASLKEICHYTITSFIELI